MIKITKKLQVNFDEIWDISRL